MTIQVRLQDRHPHLETIPCGLHSSYQPCKLQAVHMAATTTLRTRLLHRHCDSALRLVLSTASPPRAPYQVLPVSSGWSTRGSRSSAHCTWYSRDCSNFASSSTGRCRSPTVPENWSRLEAAPVVTAPLSRPGDSLPPLRRDIDGFDVPDHVLLQYSIKTLKFDHRYEASRATQKRFTGWVGCKNDNTMPKNDEQHPA
jgi:hypothetical protein